MTYSTYKEFPNSQLIRDWKSLLEMKREDVVKLHDKWKEIEEDNRVTNKEMVEKANKEKEEVKDFLKSKGIKVYNYSGSPFSKPTSMKAWYKNNIAEVIDNKYPRYKRHIPTAHMDTKEVDGVTLSNNQSPTNLVELYDNISWQYNVKIREVNKEDKLLVKSIQYATTNNIDIEGLSSKEIISEVDEHAREEFIANELPDGTELYLKHACSECSTYFVGERRCECGNRRINLVIDGDIINGHYYDLEPY